MVMCMLLPVVSLAARSSRAWPTFGSVSITLEDVLATWLRRQSRRVRGPAQSCSWSGNAWRRGRRTSPTAPSCSHRACRYHEGSSCPVSTLLGLCMSVIPGYCNLDLRASRSVRQFACGFLLMSHAAICTAVAGSLGFQFAIHIWQACLGGFFLDPRQEAFAVCGFSAGLSYILVALFWHPEACFVTRSCAPNLYFSRRSVEGMRVKDSFERDAFFSPRLQCCPRRPPRGYFYLALWRACQQWRQASLAWLKPRPFWFKPQPCRFKP